MLRRIAMVVLVAVVAAGVGFLFYYNGQPVELLLGANSTLHLPLAALLLLSFAAGAGAILIAGLLRGSAGAVRRWRERRARERRRQLDQMEADGREALWAGELERSAKLLTKVMERRPNDVPLAVALSEAHLGRGHQDDAKRVLETTRGRVGTDARILAQLGELALRGGNPGAAIEAFHEANRIRPASPTLLDGLLRALTAGSRVTDAVPIAAELHADEPMLCVVEVTK